MLAAVFNRGRRGGPPHTLREGSVSRGDEEGRDWRGGEWRQDRRSASMSTSILVLSIEREEQSPSPCRSVGEGWARGRPLTPMWIHLSARTARPLHRQRAEGQQAEGALDGGNCILGRECALRLVHLPLPVPLQPACDTAAPLSKLPTRLPPTLPQCYARSHKD